jgi:hypothetical protein
MGHFTQECHLPKQRNAPQAPAPVVNQQRGHQKSPAPQAGHTNYTTMEEIPMGEEVLVGTFFLNEHVLLFCSILEHRMILQAPLVPRGRCCLWWLRKHHM